jgi:1,2-diacylglycerol 3-alpha-glucosyltransferase
VISDFYDQCDWVVGVTDTAVRTLKNGEVRREARVISNGVDLARFQPRPRNDNLARRLGIPRKPTVLYTGRLDADKCMDVWVGSIPYVLEQMDAHFIIGGNGTDRARLENNVARLGLASHVSFPGFLASEDYPGVYSLADVFAISSPTELQSIVTLEAAASGLPLVAVNAGALPELVQNGLNGFHFEPGNSRQMAEALVRVLKDPGLQRRMGRESRKIALGHDLWGAMRKYEALYAAVTAGRTPPLEPLMAAVQSEATAQQ